MKRRGHQGTRGQRHQVGNVEGMWKCLTKKYSHQIWILIRSGDVKRKMKGKVKSHHFGLDLTACLFSIAAWRKCYAYRASKTGNKTNKAVRVHFRSRASGLSTERESAQEDTVWYYEEDTTVDSQCELVSFIKYKKQTWHILHSGVLLKRLNLRSINWLWRP